MEQKHWFDWRAGVALLAVVAIAPGCGDDDEDETPRVDGGAGGPDGGGGGLDAGLDGGADAGGDGGVLANCVEIAQENGNFTQLLAAATATGLADDLAGAGPFTIFAPTDDAFAELSGGGDEGDAGVPSGDAGVSGGDAGVSGGDAGVSGGDAGTPSEEQLAQLRTILQYHVLDTEESAADLAGLDAPGVVRNTLAGLTLFVDSEDDKVTINDRAEVTTADIRCSNGIIHVIDKVLLPLNTAEAATVAGGFDTLLEAVTNANLVGVVTNPDSPVTVFAPTDDAFDAAGLTADDATPGILAYHVISGSVLSTDLTSGQRATLAPDESVTIEVSNDGVTVNTAKVIIADIVTTTGVIHVIDKVLNPANDGVFTAPD